MEAQQPSEGMENVPALSPEINALVYGTNDPEEVLIKSTRIANLLAPIVEKTHMYAIIGGKKHIMAEGWSTMLAMLGIFPSTVYTKMVDRENELAYESEVVLKHMSGVEVGRGNAICSSKERNWSNRDEFTIRSMSQTRAFGKAARLSFSFIVKLAGYEPTAVEEMPHEEMPDDKIPSQERPYQGQIKTITDKQRKRLYKIWKQAGKTDPEVKLYLNNHYGINHTKDITMDIYDEIVTWAQGGNGGDTTQ